MSYSGRRRYKSRREKNERAGKRFKAIVLAISLAAVIYGLIHRVSIMDYLATYFY